MLGQYTCRPATITTTTEIDAQDCHRCYCRCTAKGGCVHRYNATVCAYYKVAEHRTTTTTNLVSLVKAARSPAVMPLNGAALRCPQIIQHGALAIHRLERTSAPPAAHPFLSSMSHRRPTSVDQHHFLGPSAFAARAPTGAVVWAFQCKCCRSALGRQHCNRTIRPEISSAVGQRKCQRSAPSEMGMTYILPNGTRAIKSLMCMSSRICRRAAGTPCCGRQQ